jgi:DNA-binding NarL/FixJ family response regulator
MAQVLALVPDLLFGSQVQGSLSAAGHEVELIADERRLRERLADPERSPAGALVVDLTDARFDGAGILEALARDGSLADVRTLAFYSHVDAQVRERAMKAGFDLVVPRSRMAREGPQLLEGLLGGD